MINLEQEFADSSIPLRKKNISNLNFFLLFLAFAVLIATLIVSSVTLSKVSSSNTVITSSNTLPSSFSSCPESESRKKFVYDKRVSAAYAQYSRTVECQKGNGDEELHGDFIAMFTKGMIHDEHNVVLPHNYEQLLVAASNGGSALWESIARGVNGGARFLNPQAGLLFLTCIPFFLYSLFPPKNPSLRSFRSYGWCWHCLLDHGSTSCFFFGWNGCRIHWTRMECSCSRRAFWSIWQRTYYSGSHCRAAKS